MIRKLNFLWSANKKILNNRGSSFIELLYVILYIALILTILFQVYFIIQGEILVINATRFALRQVELTGIKGNVHAQVVEVLSKNNNIDTSTLSVDVTNLDGSTPPSGPPKNQPTWQLRKPIKIKVQVNYVLFRSSGLPFVVPLSCTYVGSSQKYYKEYQGGVYDAVN